MRIRLFIALVCIGLGVNAQSEEKMSMKREDIPNMRLSLNVGYSYMLGKVHPDIPSEFDTYIDQLRSGLNYSGDFTYFFSDRYGVGAKVLGFKTQNSTTNFYFVNPYGQRVQGVMEDNISVTFIGGSFTERISTKGNGAFFVTGAVGQLKSTNSAVLIDPFTITGKTLGVGFDLGYDLNLYQDITLGLQCSFIGGLLSSVDVSDGKETRTIEYEKGKYQSLNRFDLSVGIRFNI